MPQVEEHSRRATLLRGCLGLTLLVVIGGCEEEEPPEYPWCFSPYTGCYKSENGECSFGADDEVSSCDEVRQFVVCTSLLDGCTCHAEWALSQPPSIECNRNSLGQAAVCCASSGYPSNEVTRSTCRCDPEPFTCAELVVQDCDAAAGL